MISKIRYRLLMRRLRAEIAKELFQTPSETPEKPRSITACKAIGSIV